MICHFQGKPRPGPAPRPAPACPPPADSLEPVLAGLIGREVGVLAGGQFHAGKLIRSDPVTLLGPDGQVTVVAAQAKSVQF
ncbi:MAG TPA: hypothetical protein VNT01_11925 [Symbiobacteriaceae bacterium]|nr:hypothetical protein [Symbiobacteriaceae bacterium]